jgi:hypothetical protein
LLSVQICRRCDGSGLAMVVWESAIRKHSSPCSRRLVLTRRRAQGGSAEIGIQPHGSRPYAQCRILRRVGVGGWKILSKVRGGARQTRQDNEDGGPVIDFTKPKDNRCSRSYRLFYPLECRSVLRNGQSLSGNQALTRCAITYLAKTSYFWARPFTRAMVLH